jgi:hypothetical protein
MRAGHAAAMARRRQGALSPLGPPFRPQQMGGMSPGDDGPLWQGQPQPIAETLRALSGVSAGNIASVSPQDPAEQTTPAPVVHPGTMGASEQSAPPRDEFAEAAAEAALNPDPATEREIYEYGAKEIEPPAAGQPVTFINDKGEPVTFVNNDGQPVTFVNDKGEAPAPVVRSRVWTAHGQGTLAADAQVLKRSLSERPADIRDAARALVKEIRDQVEHLQGSKPNDEEGLAKHNEFVAFLERIAAGLAELADALDQAVSASPGGPPEPMFLGKAARIAEQLNIGMMEWLEANRANVAGCTLRIGLIGAGFLFLNACGLDGSIAAIVSGLVNRGFSDKKTTTTRAKKRPAKAWDERREGLEADRGQARR